MVPGILTFLEGIGKFFNLFGETSSIISKNWFFGEYLAGWFTWLAKFIGGLFGVEIPK